MTGNTNMVTDTLKKKYGSGSEYQSESGVTINLFITISSWENEGYNHIVTGERGL